MNASLYRPQRNWGARIRDVTWQGLRAIILENELLRVAILAGKGADVVELNYKPLDLDFIWLTPGGVQNPNTFASTAPDARANFRDSYPGGWQEIFPSGGDPSTSNGASYGQHGEVFNVPWDVDIVEDTEDRVSVRCTVRTRRSPFLLEKSISMDSGKNAVNIHERLVNESPVDTHAMWGHHITFGRPFLKPGHRLRFPAGLQVVPHPEAVAPGGRRVSGTASFTWPIDPGNAVDLSVIPEYGSPSDVLYLTGFQEDNAWYELIDPANSVGARVVWDATVMPYLWFWQEFGASTGYPWYGRNFNIGLEPFSSYPSHGLDRAVANATALQLGPGETRSFSLSFAVLGGDGIR